MLQLRMFRELRDLCKYCSREEGAEKGEEKEGETELEREQER